MIKHLVLAFVIIITVPFLVSAATSSDEFTVRQQIGIDTDPPTIPGGPTTTSVASTQINIEWGSSTDAGVGLSGYVLYRDNVPIATTSLLFYSDTGLTPSTTYAYTVAAFDEFFNTSTQTPTSTATTFAPPAPPPYEGNAGALIEMEPIELIISEVQVVVEDIVAVVSFNTSGFAVAAFKYGVTSQYEIGSLANGVFLQAHQFNLTNLDPEVKYFFEITAQNQRGDVVTYTGSFVTKQLADVIPPANVSNFTAVADKDDVVLSWNNPTERDFDRVRIIANSRFYPTDIADGFLLYEGSAEFYRHKWVYPENDRMYYTIFALDAEGNPSSGAIAQISWTSPSTPGELPVEEPIVEEPAVGEVLPPGTTAQTTPTVRPQIELTFNDLEFIQNSRIRQGLQSFIDLDPNQPFTIRLPYEAVPENLKIITVTLTDPDNPAKTFSFLLRVNDPKTHYEATIGALGREAHFPLSFSFFDLKTKEIANFTGTISTIPKTEQTYAQAIRTVPGQLLFVFSLWWWWPVIIVLLLIAYWLIRD